MTDKTAQDKWNRIYGEADPRARQPARVLLENAHLLPASAEALELACGLGANAIFLAGRGLRTDAWDISDVAAAKLNALAAEQELPLHAQARDVTAQPPAPASYDIIVVSYYLERDLCPALGAALRPAGLLFYQTFTREVTPSYSGPGNPAFRLAQNELPELFPDLIVRVYREEGLAGDISTGLRNEAMLVAQKRP